jgi:DNA-binding beta-propeller fold protein YncE
LQVTTVEDFPQALEYNPFNNDIYVANRDSGTVSVIDGSGSFNIINLNSHSSTPSFEKLSLFLLG